MDPVITKKRRRIPFVTFNNQTSVYKVTYTEAYCAIIKSQSSDGERKGERERKKKLQT